MRSTRRRLTAAAFAVAISLPFGTGAMAEQHLAKFWAAPAQTSAIEAVTAEASPVGAEPVESQPIGQATWLSSFDWKDPRPGFGGFSGLEMDADGLGAIALSDRGYVIEMRIERDADGLITAVKGGPTLLLRTTTGEPVTGGNADSEGLRRLPDGRLCVSFENNARISCHIYPDSPAELLPRDPAFADLPANSSLESLAADTEGRLYTLPEEPDQTGNFRVYRLQDGVWSQPFTLPARDGFLATDADFGPDGRLYVLERKVALTSGFLSRVRSFAMTEHTALDERVVIEPAIFRHGNLEGLSVWQDAAGGIRLSLIADNAQMRLFRNEIAEYRIAPLAEAAAPR